MRATLTFTGCIQDSQEYGSNDEYMVSRVLFDLTVETNAHPRLYVDIKQVVGSNYESGAIEVGRPVGYSGPFNYQSRLPR